MTRWRAVVTDLDGTVVGPADAISPATLNAAAQLRYRGVPLLAATARTRNGVLRLGAFAGHLSVAVCHGGALGWSPAEGDRTLWQRTLPATELHDLVAFARDLPGSGLCAFGVASWDLTPEYLALRGRPPAEPWREVPLAALADQPAFGAALRHRTLSSDQLIERLTEAGFAGRTTLTYSAPHLVEIGPPGVDKATGVARALAWLGVAPAHTVAFGDMPNDLPLFALAGHAVAVGAAHPAVLAAATAHAPGLAEDGFARHLAELGLIDG
ncbi:Cof subfamily protein (haloacid dehalogenase superfamily) [Actinoplanes octamycinicus]|uniref:Cof subfamily protein (Haloacid dehalogenase superfamily) n=1 Tax=Actinoplanes octamycinicus TaxID=135948 RepID=A0A7W7GQX4_9ACTN|nr:HAD family hydrolase [Actinoplanes octamycinicus]MBB4736600.1 Cof subfamily protein (haloacid dehalogenase superfamily) [Actinoplanes octamycinicus]